MIEKMCGKEKGCKSKQENKQLLQIMVSKRLQGGDLLMMKGQNVKFLGRSKIVGGCDGQQLHVANTTNLKSNPFIFW